MQKIEPWIAGTALAIAFAVLYTLCAAAFALFPGATLTFFDVWFHGLDLSVLANSGESLTLGNYLYGLLGVVLTAFVAGTVFGLSYNFLRRQTQT